jgi:hypothetical protein
MIEIKEEFKKLIPALTAEEFKQLEENILKDGIRDPLVLWNGYLIDGHNRYQIAFKHGLEYKTIDKEFKDESEVKEWMINNQFGRRNLSNYQRSVLALELESVFSQRAKENLKVSGENFGKGLPMLANPIEIKPIDTRKELSKIANVSHGTLDKVKQIQTNSSDEVKEKLISGDMSINQAYQEIKKQKAEAYKEKIKERIETKVKENSISKEEQEMLNKIDNGETIVINMNTHFHVLKYAKDKEIYKQIDRYSEFGNPFWLDTDGTRDECCEGYIDFYKHKRSLHQKIKDLKGKVLGCHCHPLRCHGDYLKKLVDEN